MSGRFGATVTVAMSAACVVMGGACSSAEEIEHVDQAAAGVRAHCGNGRCAGGETCSSCPADCGPCPASDASTCTPTTCSAQGKNCGTLSDGCGGTLSCGSCTAPETCGGGGVPNVCATATTTCPSSIQTAVDNAPAGSTLDVTGCKFHERVTISKSMTLIGGSYDGTGLGVPLQDGVFRIAASHVTVQRIRAFGSSGAGLRIANVDYVTVSDSEFDNNVQEGYAINGNNVTIQRCHIHDNNVALTVNWGWEAGGGKGHGSNLVFDSCESDHNGGPGIWYDQTSAPYNDGAIVRNCRVHDNIGPGIMYEVSDGGPSKAHIVDNVVYGLNGRTSDGWVWPSQILISSARNVEVARNTLAYGFDGIGVISQSRSDAPGPVTGIDIHDNVVVQTYDVSGDTSFKSLIGFVQDWNGGLFNSGTGNTGANNRFWSVYPEPRSYRFDWNGSIGTLSQWNATPIGGGSTYLTTAEKDSILTNAGIPIR